MVEVDVITQEVIRARLDGIVREMQASVLRTGFSTIIRETHDFSAGILDREGKSIGQYSGLPPHLGAYPACVNGILQFYGYEEMEDGDCFLINHPYYSGCPHPNDMVVVMPVFYDGEVVAFCASMGHKSDIGGQSPGSRNAGARDIFGEGLQIMPVKFLSRRHLVKETEQFIRANSRTPDLVLGDLGAQSGALWSIGSARLKGLMDEYGEDVVLGAFEQIGQRTAERVRQEVSAWQDGVFEAEGFIDDIANPGHPIRLHVAVIKEGERLLIDFSGCGDQSIGPINVRPPFLRGSAYYAVVAMIDPRLPNNFGLAEAVECRFREGSIVNPAFPGPIGFYSVTLPIVEDALFTALAKAAGRPTVAHSASSHLVVIGSSGERSRPYVQYELLLAGSRGWDGGDGFTGTGHDFDGGSKFTSVEILESEFPVELGQFRLIPDSGGAGKFRGGPSIRRDYILKAESQFAGGADRVLRPPHGMDGGMDGRSGSVTLNPGAADEHRYVGLVSNVQIKPGDMLRVETAS